MTSAVRGLDTHGTTLTAGQLVILTTDGVHDHTSHDVLTNLIHTHDPQALADALVTAARPDPTGYRDDATAIVIAPGGQQRTHQQ
ncbi:SpoIIE family protein phosphatase [Polymorphospora sp. NPDC050346]|uniref:SpoIIE family protein phosphatase n=1 Tax=Polymorphospora sp. NPDC050346 TaxID=3155780 RepID=UPI0033CC1E1D